MTRSLIALLLVLQLALLPGCFAKIQSDYDKTTSVNQNVLDDVNPNNIHYIDEIEARIYVPEDYIVFTRNLAEEEYEKYGTTKKEFVDGMILKGFFMEAVADDYLSEISLSFQENDFTREVGNLRNASNETVQGLGTGYASGFGEYKVFETPHLRYLVYEYIMEHATSDITYNYKFKTIVNGNEVTITFLKSEEQLTEEERNMVQFCVESLTFDHLSN